MPGREYTRALLMTRLTAVSFWMFGESEWSARLPALLFGLATLPLVYIAGRVWFGPVAGVVALALTAVSVHAIDISRFPRLYALLTLLLLGCALAAYRGLEGRRRTGPRLAVGRLAWLAAAGVMGAVALTLHPVAVSLGVALQAYVSVLAVVTAARGDWTQARLYALFAGLVLLVEAAAFSVPAVRERLLQAALQPLPWYHTRPGDEWVHHLHLAANYGVLWYLLIPATFVAAAGRFKPGLFLGLLFWLPFLFVSLVVATKHPRYSIQFLPFAWLILGGAADVSLAWLRRSLGTDWPAALRRRAATATLLGLAALPVVYVMLRATPTVASAARRPLQATGVFTTGYVYDWRGAARALEPVLPPDAVVVSDMWQEAIYYLGRDAYQLLTGHRTVGAGDWETPERDYSEKIQQVPHLEALRQQRPPWVLASRERWRSGETFNRDLTRYVEATCRPVPAGPADAFAVVFDCTAPAAQPAAASAATAGGGTD